MVTETEILNDIQQIYKKVDQCYKAKEDLAKQINKEREDIVGLQIFMKTDEERIAAGKRPRYEKASMEANIQRLKDNIALFEKTIAKEDENIETFRKVVAVLQEDMKRPKEIVINLADR